MNIAYQTILLSEVAVCTWGHILKKTTDVNTENKMTILIKKLNKVSESENIVEAYLNLLKIRKSFQKSNKTPNADNIIKFRYFYQNMSVYKMSLPNTVLMFKRLDDRRHIAGY